MKKNFFTAFFYNVLQKILKKKGLKLQIYHLNFHSFLNLFTSVQDILLRNIEMTLDTF